MKVSLRLYSSTAVAAVALAITACAARRPTIDPSTVTTTTLTLSNLSPADGDVVDEKTTILADLEYSVAGFVQGQYFVAAQFEMTESGRSTDGDFPGNAYPELKEPRGRFRFSFPLKYVWKRPEVRRPFVVWYYVNRRTGPRGSTVVAKAGPVTFVAQ